MYVHSSQHQVARNRPWTLKDIERFDRQAHDLRNEATDVAYDLARHDTLQWGEQARADHRIATLHNAAKWNEDMAIRVRNILGVN
jgi:hypothetical protein